MSNHSRFLSMLLRHHPEEIGLSLDQNGWADVDVMLRLMRKSGRKITRDDLIETVETNDKKRFTLSEDQRKIRAAQGHSFDVDLGLAASEPPEFLYHGTARSNLDRISQKV